MGQGQDTILPSDTASMRKAVQMDYLFNVFLELGQLGAFWNPQRIVSGGKLGKIPGVAEPCEDAVTV